jgi:hypothetical protein
MTVYQAGCKTCSYELASIVAFIINFSFRSGKVPFTWLIAIVTPVPKVPNPHSLNDFRPISVTPLLSRLTEKLLVRNWLRPALDATWISLTSLHLKQLVVQLNLCIFALISCIDSVAKMLNLVIM